MITVVIPACNKQELQALVRKLGVAAPPTTVHSFTFNTQASPLDDQPSLPTTTSQPSNPPTLQPSTLNLQPSTFQPSTSTLHLSTLNLPSLNLPT